MENLDDKTTSGRVTRSLRKRLGSVDSDASSRPGTPILIKLPSISGIPKSDSPSRSTRKSRRNSTTEAVTPAKTPSKSTALKRVDTPDSNNTSLRRLTRRRSVSISEDDHTQMQNLPKLKFDAVAEEDSTSLEPTKNGLPKDSSPKLFTNTTGHSKSEDKLQTESVNFGSSDGIISDVEVVDLDSCDGTESEKKTIYKSKQNIIEHEDDSESSLDVPTKTLRKPIDDSSSKLTKITEESEPKKEVINIKESTQINKKKVNNKSSEEINEEGNNTELNQGNKSVNPIPDQNDLETVNASVSKANISFNTINKETMLMPAVRITRLSDSELPSVHGKNDPLIKSSPHSLNERKKNELENLKVVAFNESGNDGESKSIYPRTPGHTKSKSYINEESLKEEKKKLSFREENQSIQSNGDKQSEMEADDIQTAAVEENHSSRETLPETSTPYNPKLGEELKSSTPIVFPKCKSIGSDSINESNNVAEKMSPKLNSTILNSKSHHNIVDKEKTQRKDQISPSPDKLLRSGKIYGNSPPANTISDTPKKRNSTTPVLEVNSAEINNATSKAIMQMPHEIGNGTVATDTPKEKEDNKKETAFVASWSHSVSAKADVNTKIDVIEKNKDVCQDTSHTSTKNKHSRYESDDDEDVVATNGVDIDVAKRTEEDDEEIVELAEGENPYKKHPFIEDEAMEVDNYESGDSLGSEERCEIEENEIHDDGESLGSEDTEEENGEDVEDNDEEDSFIENVSEVSLLNYSDDEEYMEKKETVQNGNKYKRILTVVTSDSDENEGGTITSGAIIEDHPLAFEVTKMIDDDSILDDQDKLKQTEITSAKVLEPSSKELNNTSSSAEDNLNTLNDSSNKYVKKSTDLDNSNEIANKSKEYKRSSSNKSLIEHNNEETPKEKQDSGELDSKELSKDEDTKKNATTNGKPSRKTLNKSNQEEETDSSNKYVRKSADLKQIFNSNEIANKSKEYKRSSSNKSLIEHNNEESPKKNQETKKISNTIGKTSRKSLNKSNQEETEAYLPTSSIGLDSITLGKNEDPNKISNNSGKLSRKSLNKSNQEETEACLLTSSIECHNVNDKDKLKMYAEITNQSKDFGSNTSKLSDSARQLFERNDSTNTSGSDRGLENDIDHQHLSATRKQMIENLNQSDHLNKTIHEPSKDKQRASSKMETEIYEDKNFRRSSLNKSNSNKTLQSSNTNSFEKLICETSDSTNTDSETENSSKKEEKNSFKRLCGEGYVEKSINGNNDEDILTYDTDSDEEQHTNQSLPTTAKCEDKKKMTRKGSTTLGDTSTDESTAGSEICLLQQKLPNNNKMSVSFEHFKQEKNRTVSRRSLHVSFKYVEKDREEKPQTEIIGEEGSVSSTSSSPNPKQNLSDEDIEQLNGLPHLKNTPKGLEKSRQRQSLGNPTAHSEQSLSDKSSRRSYCVENSNAGYNPSASFIEKVAEQKQVVENQSKKRKRLSKSFTLGGSLDTDVGVQVHHLNKKSKISKTEHLNCSTPKENKSDNNLQHILGRCEDILEAANRAKLEAKKNYNKSKVRIPKKLNVKISPEARHDVEESQSQTELNQKELKFIDDRKKSQINQALKAATDLLLEKPMQNFKADCQLPSRTLESKYLSKTVALSDLKLSQIKNKTKDLIFAGDEESLTNSYVYQSSAGEVVETPLQKEVKRKLTTKIELSTGTVRVEPVTPTKQCSLSGFHESPMTPRTLRFKVCKILPAGQDTTPKIQHKKRQHNQYKYEEPKNTLPKPKWTQSGAFIEEDLTSRPIKHSGKYKEPKNALSKPQWTKSGVFIEEDSTSRPIKHSGSTQFFVNFLNRAEKVKKLPSSESAEASLNTATSTALQFKQSYLFRGNVLRESSREILQRKKRKRNC